MSDQPQSANGSQEEQQEQQQIMSPHDLLEAALLQREEIQSIDPSKVELLQKAILDVFDLQIEQLKYFVAMEEAFASEDDDSEGSIPDDHTLVPNDWVKEALFFFRRLSMDLPFNESEISTPDIIQKAREFLFSLQIISTGQTITQVEAGWREYLLNTYPDKVQES